MPKVIKKRVSRKPVNKEAEVEDRLTGLKDTIRQRQKVVLIYGTIILALIIGIVSLLLYDYTSNKKARRLEYEAYKVYYNEYQREPINREEQFKNALDIFKKAYGMRKSPISLYYIAGCYYELGRYDDALKVLKDFTQRYSNEEEFIPLVYQKMAMAYVKKGDINESMKTLDILYNLKGDVYKDLALMEYGRLLEKEGRLEEAKKKYKELTTKFPNSPFSDEAEARLKSF